MSRPKFLSSRFGFGLAGAYLLIVVFTLFDHAVSPPEAMSGFALTILTAPFSFLIAIFLEFLGILTSETGSGLIYPVVLFGAIVNGCILHVVGCTAVRLLERVDPGAFKKNGES